MISPMAAQVVVRALVAELESAERLGQAQARGAAVLVSRPRAEPLRAAWAGVFSPAADPA